MNTTPTTKQEGLSRLRYDPIPNEVIPSTIGPQRTITGKPKRGGTLSSLARLFKGQAEHLERNLAPKESGPMLRQAAVNRLALSVDPSQAVPFLDAVTDLTQLGFSADDMRQVAHAVQHRRILAFQPGGITDLGESARPYDGATTGSLPYTDDL